MVEEKNEAGSQESQEAVEASGDAIIIAEAIFAGLNEIANAIREMTARQFEDVEEPSESGEGGYL